ncbi:hypothetical protein [Nonomuraea candida]|nr:hypothetical protein [Nonomuraea candida]
MSVDTLVMPSAAQLEEDYQDGSDLQPITAIFFTYEPATKDGED